MGNGADLQTKRIDRLRQGAIGWINSADSKATAILTVGGAALALLAAVIAGVVSSAPGVATKPLYATLFVAFCISDLVSVGFAALVVYPRINRLTILQDVGWNDALVRSRTFFDDVAALSPDEFKKLIAEQEATLDDKDAAEQAYILQHVARSKMRSIRVSVVALGASLALLAALLIAVAVAVAL